ncbi:MAG TPA: hypothetical protein VIG08_12485 [Gemmatimonadales bacterium]|jgi:hypothetical protein
MTMARAAIPAVFALLVSSCSKLEGIGSMTGQPGTEGAPHLVAGPAPSNADEKGWHLTPYKCDDTERALAMCGEGPTRIPHMFAAPAWLHDHSTTGMLRTHKAR